MPAADEVLADIARPWAKVPEVELRAMQPRSDAEAEALALALRVHDLYRATGDEANAERDAIRVRLGWAEPEPTLLERIEAAVEDRRRLEERLASLIREAAEAHAVPVVAAAAGLTRQRVYQILGGRS